jgi:predicted dehydrogenase
MSGQPSLLYPLPPKHDYGIAIIGAGSIVQTHLTAYRKAGLNVIGICDIRREAAEATAQKWGIAHVTTDYRTLLERPDVHIVDIAIPNEGRSEIVKAAAALGKHVLIQKPFAHSFEQAKEMIQAAERGGIRLAVNQNARFAPFYYKTKQILDLGYLGVPYLMTHEMRINQDRYKAGSWYSRMAHFLLTDYEIHHIDLMRYWSGQNPESVYVSTTRMPGQNFASDMTALSILEFPDGLRATLKSVDTTQSDEHFFHFSIEGTKGSLHGLMKTGYLFPTLEYYTADRPGEWVRVSLAGSWFPDAFYGTMFELMNAIQENREPSIAGKDNYHTMRTLHAMIASSEQRRVIALSEF